MFFAAWLVTAAATSALVHGFTAVPALHRQQSTSCRASSLDYDIPSDVSTEDGSSTLQSSTAADNPKLRENIKREIMVLAATSNRGQLASQDEKDAVTDLVFSLEALNPSAVTTDAAISGTWDLVYSDVQPFRSSPFFMALSELFVEVSQILLICRQYATLRDVLCFCHLLSTVVLGWWCNELITAFDLNQFIARVIYVILFLYSRDSCILYVFKLLGYILRLNQFTAPPP